MIGFCKKYMRNYLGITLSVKSSTIIETLVASVIIVIVFSIASVTLSNVFRSSILSDTRGLDNRIDKLIYLSNHKILKLPIEETYRDWNLSITRQNSKIHVFAFKKISEEKTKEINKEITINAY